MLQTPSIVLPLQRDIRGILSELHWVYWTVIFPSPPLITPLQPIVLGATSDAHWLYGPPINIYYSQVSWNER